MLLLPPNPVHCRPLTDATAAFVRSQDKPVWTGPDKCQTCLGKKCFTATVEGVSGEYECNCIAQYGLHMWMLNAGIGLNYQRLSWGDVEAIDRTIYERIVDYGEHHEEFISSGLGMTLWAEQRGTGKTLLATLLAKDLLAKGHKVFFIQFLDMINMHTDGWRDAEARKVYEQRVRDVEVLFIDDIGRENKGRHDIIVPLLDDAIRHRIRHSKPTIITTNFGPQAMAEGYGPHVRSLLSEVNAEVHVPGNDFRPTAQERTMRQTREGIRRPVVVR